MLLHSNQAEPEVESSSIHTGAPVRSRLHGVYVCVEKRCVCVSVALCMCVKAEEDLQV